MEIWTSYSVEVGGFLHKEKNNFFFNADYNLNFYLSLQNVSYMPLRFYWEETNNIAFEMAAQPFDFIRQRNEQTSLWVAEEDNVVFWMWKQTNGWRQSQVGGIK